MNSAPNQLPKTRNHTESSLLRPFDVRRRPWIAVAFALSLTALLAAAWIAYRPGIHGVFLLDDFSNLPALGATGAVTNWDAFWRYITSGTADPLGRPLSLLSFLLDAQDWPAAAAPFKATNILLHLLNGALLCWAMLRLAHRRGIEERHAAMAALIGSGIWMLHPLFVSTTLYVVQREAMLPATFTFIGIVCWCSGRDALEDGKIRLGIVRMVTAAWLCTLLATLCKANGILLPLLLAMAEATVLRKPTSPPDRNKNPHRAISIVLLGVPIALLAAWLAYVLPGLVRATPGLRGWSISQRLLTEPRILTEYLRLLWIPQTTSFGIFNDQIHASSNWLDPWTTLPCVIFVVGLVAAAWLARRRFPVLAFAVLFYFAGQLLESSFIPLELAFEHRNYLPAAFMFWPLGLWLAAHTTRPLVRRTVAGFVLCVLAVMTWTRAGVWGNLQLQAQLWGRINPGSPQAQSFSAAVEAATGNMPAALKRLRGAAIRMPWQPQAALNLISTECRAGAVDPGSWQLAIHALHQTNTEWTNIANWFATTTPDATLGRCQGLTVAHLEQAFAAVESNRKFVRWHRDDRAFKYAQAVLDLAGDKPQQALAIFDALLASTPSPTMALEQARSLNAFGYPLLALHHLDYYATLPPRAGWGIGMPRIHARVLQQQGWGLQQIAALRKQLTTGATRKAP